MLSKTFTAAATIGGFLALSGAALAQTTASAGVDLNMRSGPGPQYDVIGVIPSAGSVTMEGCIEGGNWCRVTHEGTQGWANSDYLLADLSGEQVVITERRTDINVPVVTYEDSGDGTAVGAASGAVTGALIGGPVGALIGTAAGAVLGSAADVPEPVVTYVKSNPVEPLYLEGEVVVGASLPETVELKSIPEHEYQYVYVNGVPVVIEPGTRRIVHLVR